MTEPIDPEVLIDAIKEIIDRCKEKKRGYKEKFKSGVQGWCDGYTGYKCDQANYIIAFMEKMIDDVSPGGHYRRIIRSLFKTDDSDYEPDVEFVIEEDEQK